jgi:hypothetical protein
VKKDATNDWQKEWKDMPEFIQEDLSPYSTIKVHFRNQNDKDEFSKLVNQKITKYNVIWFPEAKKRRYANKRYIDES